MIHSLVAAGIGGKTVAEAKENLTHQEVQGWMQYIKKHGPLCVGQRLDVALARIMLLITKAAGGKNNNSTLQDFLPSYYRTKSESVDDQYLTLENIDKLF